MIFQLSDWFPKPMIWAIIVKFAQIRKNWWRISCAEILEIGKNFFAASSVKKMSRFEEVSPEKIKRIAKKFTKTVILLGLAGYELIITNSAYGHVGYLCISSYPARPRRLLNTTGLRDICIDGRLWCCVTIMLKFKKWTFLSLTVFFTLKLSRKVKACSLAENRPADLFLQVKTNNKFSSGDSDIQPESFSFRSAAEYLNFYFRHFLSTY